MVMRKAIKRPVNHYVLKMRGPLAHGYPRSEALLDAKMHGFPSDRLTQIYQSSRNSADASFLSVTHRMLMKVDRASQIEYTFDGCVDVGFQIYDGHFISPKILLQLADFRIKCRLHRISKNISRPVRSSAMS